MSGNNAETCTPGASRKRQAEDQGNYYSTRRQGNDSDSGGDVVAEEFHTPSSNPATHSTPLRQPGSCANDDGTGDSSSSGGGIFSRVYSSIFKRRKVGSSSEKKSTTVLGTAGGITPTTLLRPENSPLAPSQQQSMAAGILASRGGSDMLSARKSASKSALPRLDLNTPSKKLSSEDATASAEKSEHDIGYLVNGGRTPARAHDSVQKEKPAYSTPRWPAPSTNRTALGTGSTVGGKFGTIGSRSVSRSTPVTGMSQRYAQSTASGLQPAEVRPFAVDLSKSHQEAGTTGKAPLKMGGPLLYKNKRYRPNSRLLNSAYMRKRAKSNRPRVGAPDGSATFSRIMQQLKEDPAFAPSTTPQTTPAFKAVTAPVNRAFVGGESLYRSRLPGHGSSTAFATAVAGSGGSHHLALKDAAAAQTSIPPRKTMLSGTSLFQPENPPGRTPGKVNFASPVSEMREFTAPAKEREILPHRSTPLKAAGPTDADVEKKFSLDLSKSGAEKLYNKFELSDHADCMKAIVCNGPGRQRQDVAEVLGDGSKISSMPENNLMQCPHDFYDAFGDADIGSKALMASFLPSSRLKLGKDDMIAPSLQNAKKAAEKDKTSLPFQFMPDQSKQVDSNKTRKRPLPRNQGGSTSFGSEDNTSPSVTSEKSESEKSEDATKASSPSESSPSAKKVKSLWGANMFMKPGEWKCSVCLCKNPATAKDQCMSCETPRPGSGDQKSTSSTKKDDASATKPKFTFGTPSVPPKQSTDASKEKIVPKFQFGVPTPKTETKVETPSTSKQEEGGSTKLATSSDVSSAKSSFKSASSGGFIFGKAPIEKQLSNAEKKETAVKLGSNPLSMNGSQSSGFSFSASKAPLVQTNKEVGASKAPNGAEEKKSSPKPALLFGSIPATKVDGDGITKASTPPAFSSGSQKGKEVSSLLNPPDASSGGLFGNPSGTAGQSSQSESTANSGSSGFMFGASKSSSSAGQGMSFGSSAKKTKRGLDDSDSTQATSKPVFSFGATAPSSATAFAGDVPKFTFGVSQGTSQASTSIAPKDLVRVSSPTPTPTPIPTPAPTPNVKPGNTAPSMVPPTSFSGFGSVSTTKSAAAPALFGASSDKLQPNASSSIPSFQASAPAPAPASAPFRFGASSTAQPAAPNTAMGSFGGSAPTAPNSGFTFGSTAAAPVPAATPGAGPAPNGTTASGGPFAFGTAASTVGVATPGTVAPSTAPTPSFGVTPSTQSFGFGQPPVSMGATPSATPAMPAVPGMNIAGGGFNMGVGGSSTHGRAKRRILKARRPPRA